MESRHPPYQHAVQMSPPPPPHTGMFRSSYLPSPYRQEQGGIPHYTQHGPPPPPSQAPPPPDRYYHQRRQTLDGAPGPPPRSDHRPTLSYPPPFIPQQDQYQRDGPAAGPDAREGYGIKRSHDEAMNGDAYDRSRRDGPFLPEHHAAATSHQHPPYTYRPPGAPSHHNHQHPPHPPPHPPPIQHAPDTQKIGNGSMYQPPPSRSPPPPSPYANRPMLPPESPHYTPQYGPPGPPQQGPLPQPPYSREVGPSTHRPGSGMSISAMLDHGPSRPPNEQRYYQSNGPPVNGHSHYPEREGNRGPYPPHENRSLTPDSYRPRHHDLNRPSRAYSGGDAHGRPMISPEKIAFGPPLPPAHHESNPEMRPGVLPPHNSAPQSRRASITAAGPPLSDRPSTGHMHGPYQSHGPPSVDHVGVPRPPPPPLHGPLMDHDPRNMPYGPHGPPDQPAWDDRGAPKPAPYPHYSVPPMQHHSQQMSPGRTLPQYGPAPRPLDAPMAGDESAGQINGHGHPSQLPVYGPAPNPAPPASAPPAPEQGPRLPFAAEGRKLSVDALQQARLESPLPRHRHLMDRTNSTGSARLSVAGDKKRAASPLPQAVQGAQAQPKGPASEPSIKGEFGRMFFGLGGVTPTRTPVELATKRYASPAAERDMDSERRASGTPFTGRLDLADKQGRAASRTGKRNRKARDDDGMSSPTLELARSLSGRGPKRSRNSYIGVDSTSPVLGRNDPAVPWAAGSARQRSFTPTSYAALSASKRAAQSDREHQRALERDREREERRPKTIVTSKLVVDSVKNKLRKHLGSMLYDVKISPEKVRRGEEGSRFGFDSKPELIPRFEEKDNCTFTVRVSRRFLTARYREEVVERRNLWGSEVFTDDSDVLAAAIHSGWIRGEWADDADISMLNLGGQPDHEYRPNGRSSLSVSVSPELSRKTLANGSRPVNGSSSVSPSKDARMSASDDNPDVLSAAPKTGPVVPPPNRDAHITLLILPRLQSYASTVNNGIKSRAWGKCAGTTAHDGGSFMIHKIEWVDEGPGSRRTERGAEARHRRVEQGIRDRMGLGKGFNLGEAIAASKDTGNSTSNGVGANATQTNNLETAQTVAVGA